MVLSERIQAFIAFGLGFFYFGISMVPPEMEFIVKVLGFKGNRPLACELLQRTAKVPECGKSVEASLILYIVNFWLMDEREAAVETLRGLKTALPNSPLILLLHGWQSMIKDHDTDVSIECYKTAYGLAQVPQLKLGCLQQLSWAYYLREEWALVVETVEAYIEKNKDSGSYSAFSMAVAMYMLNRRDDCTTHMKQCLALAEKSNNWDSWAVNCAQSYLETNDFDRCHLLFILAENSNDAGFADRALKYLDEIESLPSWRGYSADDKKAMHAYFKGCALRIQKKFDESKDWLIKAAAYHGKTLALGAARAVPYSLVVLGEMQMRDIDPPNLDRAASFFAKAKSYDKKFLFHQLLQFRLKSDLESLDCKKQKEASGSPANKQPSGLRLTQ